MRPGPDGIKLVAAMLARDEAGRFQPALTQHLLEFCDEVRVLDDNSQDQTGELLERLDWKVRVKRIMGASHWDLWGEGQVRQMLLDWTLITKPSHVLAIDADECIPDGRALRRAIARNPDADVFTLRMVEVWDRSSVPWKIRVDGQWGPRDVPICWKVPPLDAYGKIPPGWEIRDVKLASGREPEIVATLGAMGDAVSTRVDICHLGWSIREDRRPRYERYMRIDGGRFHADEHLKSILEPPTLEDYPAHREVVGI